MIPQHRVLAQCVVTFTGAQNKKTLALSSVLNSLQLTNNSSLCSVVTTTLTVVLMDLYTLNPSLLPSIYSPILIHPYSAKHNEMELTVTHSMDYSP